MRNTGENAVSVPDALLDEPDQYCRCGNFKQEYERCCDDCRLDHEDLYSEMRFQDRYEGREP